MTPVDVFDYADYRSYLTDYLAWKRKSAPGFSVRQFCLKAGLSTENYLLRILRHKRNLGPKIGEKFAEMLALKGAHHRYFMTLLYMEGAKTSAERARHLAELERMRRKRQKSAPITDNSALRHWYIGAIWELASCKGFDLTPANAVTALKRRISVQEAKEAIEFLKTRAYIVEVEGRWQASEAPIASTHGVDNAIVKLNHRETVQAALDSIDLPLEKRGFFGLTLAVDRARIPELKKRLKQIMDDLQTEYAYDTSANSVYRINSHCFPLAEL